MTLLLLTPALAASADAKIINGEPATEADYPASGAMLAEIDFSGQRSVALTCSSTLIAPDVVLLAAHCVDELLLTYGFGTLESVGWSRQADLTAWTEGLTSFPDDTVMAWDWVQHPEWDISAASGDAGLGVADWKDIALIFLEDPVDEDFIYLLQDDELHWLQEDVEVEVVGWGMQVAAESQWEPPPEGTYGIKRQGVSFVAELGESEFQVGSVEGDVRKCHGDSGGPSFLRAPDGPHEGELRLVGVTSHAYDQSDCDSKGGVDTRVDTYLSWIEEELVSRCTDGSRAWCDEEGLPVPVVKTDVIPAEEEPGLFGCTTAPAGGLVVGLFGMLALRRREQA